MEEGVQQRKVYERGRCAVEEGVQYRMVQGSAKRTTEQVIKRGRWTIGDGVQLRRVHL